MPRSVTTNVYTLPYNNFVTGQPILAAQFTGLSPAGNFTDIATVLSATVPTAPAAGVALMTAPFPLAAGTLALPGVIFGTDTATGWYRAALNSWAYSANGVLVVAIAANGFTTYSIAVTFSASVTFSGAVYANGNIAAAGQIQVGTSALAQFNCQLVPNGYSTNTSAILKPYGGNLIFINGQNYVLPATTTLSLAGLSASTFYYVYAYLVSTTITLEAVTTSPQTDPTYGHKRKTGDSTRTLVGAIYTNGSTQIAYTDGFLNMMSYYNRKRRVSWTYFTADRSLATAVTSTWPPTWTEINSEIQNQFIAWNDEQPKFYHRAQIKVTATNAYTYSGLAVDTNIAGLATDAAMRGWAPTFTTSYIHNLNFDHTYNLAAAGLVETAIHKVSMMGAGTATWYSDAGINAGAYVDGACSIGVEVNQ